MRVALFAADDIAIPLCRFLIAENMLACLVTQPDKPRGRGKKTVPLPIRAEAAGSGSKVIVPSSLKSDDFKSEFRSINPDIPLVFAYGLFIPKWIRNWKPFPCVNVHPSLLPRWRGPDPVRGAILAGDKETGITLHFTEKKMDAGDIILVSETVPITEDQTYSTLRSILSEKALIKTKEFLEALTEIEAQGTVGNGEHSGKLLIREKFNCKKQDESEITHTSKIAKSDTWIDWNKSATEIHNQIRGLSDNPGARTGNVQKPLKVLQSRWLTDQNTGEDASPGECLEITDDAIVIKCGEGKLMLLLLQPAGKRTMNARDFVNGYRIKPGDNLAYPG